VKDSIIQYVQNIHYLNITSYYVIEYSNRKANKKIIEVNQLMRNRGMSVSKMTELRAGRPGFDSREEQVRNFLSLRHLVQIASGAHLPSYPMDTGGSFPRGKAAGA
jgi:hypothetical protein